MTNESEPKVDRSRLTLLLGLTSTAAAAGCSQSAAPAKKKNPYATFDKRNVDAFEPDGGGGSGGSGH